MSNFMPINEATAQALNARLSETIFKSAADFVKFYNSGLINKKNEEVTKIANEVTSVFKDVKERGGDLIFLSQQEVFLNEVLAALTPWEILVKAKREVNGLIETGAVTPETTLAFSKRSTGFVLKVSENAENEQGESLVKLGTEKLFTKFDEIEAIFASGLIDGELNGDSYYFYAQELADLDDSFITRIRSVLPE